MTPNASWSVTLSERKSSLVMAIMPAAVFASRSSPSAG